MYWNYVHAPEEPVRGMSSSTTISIVGARPAHSATNQKLEPACRAAFIVYGLFIEWLETFNPEITESGFEYEV